MSKTDPVLQRILTMHRVNFKRVEDVVFGMVDQDDPVLLKESRRKVDSEVLRKLADDDKEPHQAEELFDISGFRFVCLYADEVEPLADKLRHCFEKAHVKPVEPESFWAFGYTGLHVRANLSEEEISRYGLVNVHDSFKLEVQVRTISQHTWSVVEHEYRYKPEREGRALPRELARGFALLSAKIEDVDAELMRLRDSAKHIRKESGEGLERNARVPVHVESVTYAIEHGGAATKHDAMMSRIRGQSAPTETWADPQPIVHGLRKIASEDLAMTLKALSTDRDYAKWLETYNARDKVKRRAVKRGDTLRLYVEYRALREGGVELLAAVYQAMGWEEGTARMTAERMWHEVQVPFTNRSDS